MRTRRTLLIALAAILLIPTFASAQEEAPELRFYIVPMIGTGAVGGPPGSGIPSDPFRPKYFDTLGIAYSAMPYGTEHYLVGAVTTSEQHSGLIANSDVIAIPPLDQAVGGNPTLNRVRNDLASRSIPGSWVQSTTTYRVLVGRVGKCAQILGRMRGTLGRHLFGPGVSLSTTLTTTLRDEFIATGESFAALGVIMDTSAITTSVTVEEAILLLADQFPAVHLAGEIFQ